MPEKKRVDFAETVRIRMIPSIVAGETQVTRLIEDYNNSIKSTDGPNRKNILMGKLIEWYGPFYQSTLSDFKEFIYSTDASMYNEIEVMVEELSWEFNHLYTVIGSIPYGKHIGVLLPDTMHANRDHQPIMKQLWKWMATWKSPEDEEPPNKRIKT